MADSALAAEQNLERLAYYQSLWEAAVHRVKTTIFAPYVARRYRLLSPRVSLHLLQNDNDTVTGRSAAVQSALEELNHMIRFAPLRDQIMEVENGTGISKIEPKGKPCEIFTPRPRRHAAKARLASLMRMRV